MIFKDINCGFYVQRRPLQYACLHDEVAALAERNQIVARASIATLSSCFPPSKRHSAILFKRIISSYERTTGNTPLEYLGHVLFNAFSKYDCCTSRE